MSPNESNLERDFSTLLEFDRHVESYEAQPLKLSFIDLKGRRQPGWPDFLVHFAEAEARRPELVDVKYRTELFEKWRTLKPRLKAARAYALAQGWTYRLKTDVEIRTPRLLVAQFLTTFRHLPPNREDQESILGCLERSRRGTVKQILEQLSSDKWRQAEIIPSLWHLVATFRIEADLGKALGMKSEIWLPGGR